LASASPPQGGKCKKSRQSKSLAAFLNLENTSFSRKPIRLCNRLVSTTRIWERLAFASSPSIFPIGIRRACLRGDVVRGTTKHASGPKPLKITHGLTYHSPFPSCSVPMFMPNLHHYISRTV